MEIEYYQQEGENLTKDLKILEKDYFLANQELEKAKIILENEKQKEKEILEKKSRLFWTKTPWFYTGKKGACMRKILLMGLILQALFSEEAAQELLQCSAIFESKKAELKDDLRQLSEKEQSLRILQTENARLLDEKNDLLNQKEKEVEEKLKNLAAKEEAFKTLQTEEKNALKIW